MRRAAAAIALLLSTVLLLSSCIGVFAPEEETVLTPTPAPMTLVPQAGGDMFIAIPDDIRSFDPLTVTSEDLINFLTLIYETPFTYTESGQLQNCLIDSWSMDEGQRTFTFRLREDVFFSDGDQLTAEDVAASGRRVLQGSGTAMSYQEQEEEGEQAETTGEEQTVTQQTVPANRYSAYNREILRIEATGEFEVTVELYEPGNAALYFMTFPVTKASFNPSSTPVGTGPYMVDSYTPGSEAVLVTNPLWWREPAYIDRIVAKAVTGPTQKLEMLSTSILDFVTTDAVNSGNYNITGQWQVIDYMTDYYDCLVPNLRHPALRQANVRRAISAALDRRELLSTVLLNHGVPSLLPIAPDYFAVDSRYRSGQSSLSEAAELLEEAGYLKPEVTDDPEAEESGGQGSPMLLELRLIVPDTLDSTYKREAARAIAKQLGRVGIGVEVAELSEEDYLKALETSDFDLAYCSYYLSEVPNLSFMFDVDGAGNYGHVDDPELTQAINDCKLAITEEEVIEACGVLQERLSSLLPQIGLYFRMNSIICDEGIHGIADVRQNAVFATVSDWFNTYFAQTVEQASAAPTAAETRRQTEPEPAQSGPADSEETQEPTRVSWGPAPDPTQPGEEGEEPSPPQPEAAPAQLPASASPSAERTQAPASTRTQNGGIPSRTSWGPAPDPPQPED
ncbi:MAG: hypothetical protein HDQ87_10455 [Clostridia bacterium]|nr:hypothetical protein [Clostridia bacterium]